MFCYHADVFTQANEMKSRGLLEGVTDSDMVEMRGQSTAVMEKVYRGMSAVQRKTSTQLCLRQLMEVCYIKWRK